MRSRFKSFVPVVIVFILLNSFFIAGRTWLQRWNADQDVLIIGNGLLFLLTLVSFLLALRGLDHTNPHVFVRSVYVSVMLKLFICMIAAFVYISMNKAGLNKPAFFTCMGLYLVYTFMEVGILTRLLKRNKNA